MQTLVMGFGGSGAYILTALKELSVLKNGRMPENVRFLLFDTIADWQPGKVIKTHGGAVIETLARGTEAGTSLDPNTEYFFLGDRDPDLKRHVRFLLTEAGNPNQFPHLKEWLHAPWLGMLPVDQLNIRDGAAQQRQIGRFAFFQNAEQIVARIRQELRELSEQTSHVNVWLVGSAAGGTAAGCLIDAAFLTRLAAREIDLKVSGVIVLPEVYDGKEGISLGRAYSMFRELERVQSRGFKNDDKYVDEGMVLGSVQFDSHCMIVSRVDGPLFDYLFYVGKQCDDQTREHFFTAVANGIDPYLDEFSARQLLQDSLNSYAAASSFGAARFYVPTATLGELFAWEQVIAFIDAAAAPSLEGNIVKKLHSGEAADRQREARNRLAVLLPLFSRLLALAGKRSEEVQRFGALLTPQRIVREFFGLGGASMAGIQLSPAEQHTVQLTYINPFHSFAEEDVAKVPGDEIEVKTFNENKRSNGPRENYLDSRDRFLRELEQHTRAYLTAEPAERTLQKGKRLLLEKVSSQMQEKVDALVSELMIQETGFAVDPGRLYEGTPLTRLRAVVTQLVSDRGPLTEIEQAVLDLIKAAENSKSAAEAEANRSAADLRAWKLTGLPGFRSSVEGDQQVCRDAQSAFVEAIQRLELLGCMQQLIRDLKLRFQSWLEAIERMLQGLVLHEKDSAYAKARQRAAELHGRLFRLSQNEAARIHLQSFPDESMHGYRARLQGLATTDVDGRSLFQQPLATSRWRLSVTEGRPGVTLMVSLPDDAGNIAQHEYDRGSIAMLRDDLRVSFQRVIDRKLARTDVFEYIRHMMGLPDAIPVDRIAQVLADSSQVLLHSGGDDDPLILIYRPPASPDKQRTAQAIQQSLGAIVGRPISTNQHSDANSVTFLRIRKPNLADIDNIIQCQNDYIQWQIAQVGTGNDAFQKQLGRALVFHSSRPELEAWYIERRYFQRMSKRPQPEQLIPPRIVRLLEHPAIMQAFVQAIATGAVSVEDKSWVWRKSPAADGPRIILTDYDHDGFKDVIRAAVVFVLRQKEGRAQGITPILLAEVRESIVAFARAAGKTKEQMFVEFRDHGIDEFLAASLPPHGDRSAYERELHALRMIFDFYCDPDMRTDLRHRLDLAAGVAHV